MMSLSKGVAASILLSLAPLCAAAQTELIYNSFLPPFDPLYQSGIRDLAAAIEEESEGAITVTIPDASFAPSHRQYEMVRDSIADMAIVSTGDVGQLVTMNEIAELPFSSPSGRAASIALWKTYTEFFEPLNEYAGGLGSLSFAVFISQDRWDQLTEDERGAIERAADGLSGRIGTAFDRIETEAAEQLSEVTRVSLEGEDLASFQSVLNERIEDWKERAADAGLDAPDEVLSSYEGIIEREAAAD